MVVKRSKETVAVRVRGEIFGLARMVCGRRYANIDVPATSRLRDLVSVLSESCPELVGKVIAEDRSALLSSYTFNLNGTVFVSDGPLNLASGDTLLLFSSQAGG